MTLLYMDGFDLNDRTYRYANAGNAVATGRLGTGRCIQVNSTGNISTITFPAANEVVCGVAMNTALNRGSISFRGDAAATGHIAVVAYTDGSVAIRRGTAGSGTTIASLPAGSLAPNAWHYIEAKVTISDTVGEVEVRANGGPVPILTFTGDTKNGGTANTIDGILLEVNGTTSMQYDDLYILDTTGAAPNNDFLGDVKIVLLEPSGNGNYSQLTGSDADSVDNYLLVDDAASVATADYVAGATAALKDSYAMDDLSGVATVFAIQELAIVQKSDAGAASMKQLLRRAGTDYTTVAAGLSTSWSELRNIRATDPSTGNQWTVSGVNAIEAGVETA
jgi:hypothetical protein